jgi:hypothetical protein
MQSVINRYPGRFNTMLRDQAGFSDDTQVEWVSPAPCSGGALYGLESTYIYDGSDFLAV